MADRSFGVSTRLFADARLTRDHLVHVAAHGFDAIEVYAAPDHFDGRPEEAGAELAEWLSDTRLRLHSVHAPHTTALEALEPLLDLTRVAPYEVLVVHRPPGQTEKALQAVIERAARGGVKVAVEARGRDATIEALVNLLEGEEAEGFDAGICFDFGHANRAGDVGELLEAASGHVLTTHVHDNRGRQDDRLVPYAGRIPWDEAMMEIQKIGYDGALIFEYAPGADPVDVLARTMKARERLEKAFITF